MDEGGFLAKTRITVIGLGLMGGSFALALKGHCQEINGVDRAPAVVDLALVDGIIDHGDIDLKALLPQTDLLVLAAPVRANIAVLEQLPDLTPGRLSVIDLSSTKKEVAAAMERLPERIAAIGGHPMCGKETAGLPHADGQLFQRAVFVLTKTQNTTPNLLSLAEEIVAAIGARPLHVDAQTHDRLTAASSHVPFIVAAALAASTPPEAAPFVSTGFGSTSRLAGSNVSMALDILLTNREPVLETLAAYREALDQIETALRDSPENLRPLLEAARANRGILLNRKE